ncbi:MAG TPA: MFS transporter [Trebonia sp.]|nr:MFS transporter [Trebonia sp.]
MNSSPAPPPQVNGRAAIATLTFLGFALQLVQVGLLPLLPVMGKSLGASTVGTSWILTSGLISGAVFLAVLTRLADLIGKRPVILIALVLVLIGSLIDSFATTLPLILVGRVLIGAQLPMLALPEAVASDTMPPKRAHTAIFAIHVGTGLGVAGGLLTAALVGKTWHAFFVVCAVSALIGLIATVALVRDSPARARGGLDVPGAVLLAATMVALMLGLSEGPTWGWDSAAVLGLLIGGVALGAAWWLCERAVKIPLIAVSYLGRRDVGLPLAMTLLMGFGIYGSLSAITRLAQTPGPPGIGYGWSSLAAGWYALPQTIGAVLGIFALRVARRRGLTPAAAIGFALIVICFVGYALGHAVSGVTLTAEAFDACGLAVGLAATQLLVVGAVPAEESGIALGLTVVMYAVGNTVGSTVFGVLFAQLTSRLGLPALSAYIVGFVLCGACALAALALCAPLARHRPLDPAGETTAGETATKGAAA